VTSSWFSVTLICRRVRWKVDEESDSVKTDMENDGTFLDLMFTNAPVDVFVTCADSLLKLDRYHRNVKI
jgi:hypothetical protein